MKLLVTSIHRIGIYNFLWGTFLSLSSEISPCLTLPVMPSTQSPLLHNQLISTHLQLHSTPCLGSLLPNSSSCWLVLQPRSLPSLHRLLCSFPSWLVSRPVPLTDQPSLAPSYKNTPFALRPQPSPARTLISAINLLCIQKIANI